MKALRKHAPDALALVALVVVALAVGGYILSNQRLRLPLLEEQPFVLKAELHNAQAVQPGQGQTVRVAGVEVGQIGAVEIEDGRAVIELQIKPKYRGLIRRGATALLRTRTGLKDMFLELDPGEGRPLRQGERIRAANTLPDINPDEVLAALDADTRDYLRLLLSGAGKGLKGRGSDLREAFARLGPLHRDLARVSGAVASRRVEMRRLVHNYGSLMTHLGRRDGDIKRLVAASDAALSSLASEDHHISAAVAQLPATLRQSERTLGKVDRFAPRLATTLDELRPAIRLLDPANDSTLPLAGEGTPILRRQIRPLVRVAKPFTADLGASASRLARAAPNLSRSLQRLNRLFNIAAYNPGGAERLSAGCAQRGACSARERNRNEGYLFYLAWTGQNTNSIFNTADAQGPLRRVSFGGLNCGVYKEQSTAVGVPEAEAALLTDLFDSLGGCVK